MDVTIQSPGEVPVPRRPRTSRRGPWSLCGYGTSMRSTTFRWVKRLIIKITGSTWFNHQKSWLNPQKWCFNHQKWWFFTVKPRFETMVIKSIKVVRKNHDSHDGLNKSNMWIRPTNIDKHRDFSTKLEI